MRIVFDARVLTHQHYTGVENYTAGVLKALSPLVDVMVAKPKCGNKYLTHLWSHFVLPFKKGALLFCPANTAPFFVPKSKKVVLTLHDVAFLRYGESFSPLFKWYYRLIVPHNLRRADSVITISEASKKEITAAYPFAEKKIEVIPLGIGGHFTVMPEITKEKMLLYVGSLNPRKNFASVIKAFLQLERSDYRLVIVGNFTSHFTHDSSTLKVLETAEKHPRIDMLPHIGNMELAGLYSRAALFLFPSYYEGFGLPPLEAMACGTPVIVSSISSMPEVCGDAALYCDPHSIDDIASKISQLLADESLRSVMREKGLAHVKKYRWEAAAQKHLDLFFKVTKE